MEERRFRRVTDDVLQIYTVYTLEIVNQNAEFQLKVGKKDYRYPDIESTDPTGAKHYHNVGKATKKGQPVTRERDALEDLRRTNKETHFWPIDLER